MATEEQEHKDDRQPMTLGEQVATITAKVDMVIGELQQQREDLRRAQEKHDADMKEMREDIKGTFRHIQGLTIAAMVGIVAIAGATWAFMWSSTRNNPPPTNQPAQTTQVVANQPE